MAASTIAPTTQAFAQASLYVGDLDPNVTETQLQEVFNSHVGGVLSARVCRDAHTRRSLGYAYVNFQDHQLAENAILSMNYSLINGKPCRIMWSRRDPSSRKNPKANLFVKNLEKSIESRTLHDLFSSAGDVLSCKIATDEKGNSRGFAYVLFADAKDAEKAIEKLDGLELNEMQVSVMPFQSRQSRGGAESTFTNVYFARLPTTMTKEAFEALGAEAGKATSVFLPLSETGECRGFGFINYESNGEARRAVELLNGRSLTGAEKPIYVHRAMKKSERDRKKAEERKQFVNERRSRTAFSNTYVKNLGEDVTDEKLMEVFSQYGAVTSAKVMRTEDGTSKGFAFVCFASTEEATAAITGLHNVAGPLGSKPLYVSLAEPKAQRLEKLRTQSTKGAFPRPAGGPTGAAYAGPAAYSFPGMYGSYPPVRAGQYYSAAQMQQAQAQQGAQRMAGYGVQQGPGAAGRGGRMPYGQQPMQGAVAMGRVPAYVNQAQPQPQQQPQQQMRRGPDQAAPSLRATVAALGPDASKQFLGEAIYPVAYGLYGEDAGKLTGMLLELANDELISLIENQAQLRDKITEAANIARSAPRA